MLYDLPLVFLQSVLGNLDPWMDVSGARIRQGRDKDTFCVKIYMWLHTQNRHRYVHVHLHYAFIKGLAFFVHLE